jgi:hypothetical protein
LNSAALPGRDTSLTPCCLLFVGKKMIGGQKPSNHIQEPVLSPLHSTVGLFSVDFPLFVSVVAWWCGGGGVAVGGVVVVVVV